MKNILFLITIWLDTGTLIGETIGTYYGQTIVKPLGYMAPRPPAGANMIDIGDIRVSFHAKQVCGYTDWSTAAITMPKHLLSGKYWEGVGNKIKQQAIDSILAISGALPNMLACSASPNFCAILNKAEAMAQANLKFTFDTCQMLEGISDTTKSHFGPLANCVQNHVREGLNQSQAIDKCTVGNRNPSSVRSREKINKASEGAKNPYKSEKLTKRLCKERSHSRYRSSSHAYSISEVSCKWFKEFFPGISAEATGKLRHGGTFSTSPAEDRYEETIKESSILLVNILEVMHQIRFGNVPYSSEGPKPRHIVVSHPDVLKLLGQKPNGKIKGVCYPEDGSRCENNISGIPPIYKLSSGQGRPSLLIVPETLYELVELIPRDSSPSIEYEKEVSHVSLALEPLIQSLSYLQVQDVVKDGLMRLSKSCSDPDLQSKDAQEDCKARLRRLNLERTNLKIRVESDRKLLIAQSQFYQEVERIRSSRIRVKEGNSDFGVSEFSNPNEVR